MSASKIWRVGVLGTGYWSEHHLNAWSAIPGARVSALCNRSPGKLAARAAQFGVPAERTYASLDDMLAADEIDVVDIVTGPETHLELVVKAAEAGKHIMCQKPFASSMVEAKAMVAAAEKAGVRLMVTENWRWLEPNRLIKRLLDDGAVGQVRMARYTHTDFYTPRMAPGKALPQPFFREMPRLLFYEMGAHWFDTWRFLFGESDRLYAQMLRVSPHIAGEDSGIVTLSGGGFAGLMDMSWATRGALEGPVGDPVGPAHREQLIVEGDLATIKLYRSGRLALIGDDGAERTVRERTTLDHAASHLRLQTHFIDRLNDGAPFETDGADNLRTLALMFAAYESARTHLPVSPADML
ncbi:Gfo/Idh/MocA family protein [Cohnella rhizosphaerae]|uniref:Gfo/Idh/MocA family oxidoreductase n=1 Tax=Cohnella rhizosphaerae TaxID=1457232 RepID=A0A9X4QV37_9BACL|nr:Gfo/Idh/MocA family oxidoreductase [Cohnella rhizosphaerae]MDG0812891.1 Gfo/Idh/MocA family oxidoreductase [Cohnella rhizosphaerae]